MKSIAMNSNNDIYIDPKGGIAMATGQSAIVQNCKSAMQAQLGEMQYDTARGMPFRTTMFDQYNPAQFTASARATLSAVAGVVSIEGFTIDRSGDTIKYEAQIKTIYGIEIING